MHELHTYRQTTADIRLLSQLEADSSQGVGAESRGSIGTFKFVFQRSPGLLKQPVQTDVCRAAVTLMTGSGIKSM